MLPFSFLLRRFLVRLASTECSLILVPVSAEDGVPLLVPAYLFQ